MSDATTLALVSTAAATSVLHALIPDHWLPFVLIGRARGWGLSTVALASGAAALLHSALSVALGLAALWIGRAGLMATGHTLEGLGGGLLVLFGVAYAAWAWTKAGHFHPFGSLLHRKAAGGACTGHEGPGHPEHLHYHADGGLISPAGERWGALGLAVIVGINPCVLVMPVMLASLSRGAATVGLVALAYAVPAALLMVGLSVIGVRVPWPIRLPGAARYAEAASGVIIAALGLATLLLEH